MNPTQSDLHVNIPLTNVSIAYIQSSRSYIADKVFPKLPVQHQSNLYWKYSKSDWRRTDVERRAPSTETKGVGWNTTTDNYFCHVYGVHKDIDDQIRANADSVFQMDRDATEFVTNQMLMKRDLDWNDRYFKKDVWDTNLKGVAATPGPDQFLQWSDSTSDPIGDVSSWLIEFRKQTGMEPNAMVLGAHTMAALKQHPDIIERIKYTQRGIVSEDLIATLFDIKKLYTSYATTAVADQTNDPLTQDKSATYDFITPSKSALILHTTKSPSLMTPTAGYSFTWNRYLAGGSNGIRIKRFRQERISSDRIEAEMTYDMKVVCPDLGVFVGDAVK